ncbi:MAG: FxsA family protein [Alphaproteobacteria bacterium]
MALIAILPLLIVPIIEIVLFIEVGGVIGLWPTLGAILATAVAGGLLLRHQGLSVLARMRQSLERGRLPVEEVFHGLCLFLAASFLLTPGFVTDSLGVLLLLPPVRRLLIGALLKRLVTRIWTAAPKPPGAGPGGVIDGEYTELGPEGEELPPPRADRSE